MEPLKIGRLTLCFLACTVSALLLWPASGFVPAATSEKEIFTGIKGVTRDGFPYISGGFGTDERQAMEELAKEYNLKVVFAALAGQYVADTQVVIEGARGKEILSASGLGPWFYIKLPTGQYGVRATFRGVTKEIKNLKLVEGKRVSRFLHWKLGGS